MRKHEALYDWLAASIEALADSEYMEEYAATIDGDARVESFARITEEIRGIGADLRAAKASRSLAEGWETLEQLLRDLIDEFDDYSLDLVVHLQFHVMVAKKLTFAIDPEKSEDILNEQFEETELFLQELESAPPLAWFVHENADALSESLVIVAPLELLRSRSQEFERAVVSPDLLFHLLSAICLLDAVPERHLALTKLQEPIVESAAVDAFARLMILTSGSPINKPNRYLADVSILDVNSIKVGPSYQQWNELLQVISDYNSASDLLVKYLMLYHVVENFMFKLPIVELERQYDGRMFSIRNFRQLYKRVEVDEKQALKRLFKKTLEIEAHPGTSFQQHIVGRWQTLSANVPEAEIEAALGELGIIKGQQPLPFGDFDDNPNAPSYFSQMIYALRCAIVHNKETELHLTHNSLNRAYLTILSDFLIPSLEELCFALIGSPNDQVWYQHKEMTLYT